MRLIDATEAATWARIHILDATEKYAIIDFLRECATIEAEPVRHGRWVDHMCRDWRCSECGEKINKVRNVDGYCYDDKPHYCPNCGAKMDGGEEK